MATIGTFTKTNAGFTGTIQTIGLKAKVAITPVEKRGDTAPDFRAFVGKVEIGAAGHAPASADATSSTSSSTTRAFAAPIYANLIEREGQHELIAVRRKPATPVCGFFDHVASKFSARAGAIARTNAYTRQHGRGRNAN